MTVSARPPAQKVTSKRFHERSTILVVDDHRPNLLAMEAALSPLGERLEHATSGEEALRLLKERDFAVALLDVRMPGLSGIEVAARLRALEILTPIIFLTADHGSIESRSHGYDQGAVDFILKPFDPHVLRAKVRVFVELHKQRAELESLSSLYASERLIARKRVQTLAMVADKLSRWLTREEVARLVTTDAHEAVRARGSEVYLRSEGESDVQLVTQGGESPGPLARPARLTLEEAHPIARAVRAGQAVWVESRESLVADFPDFVSAGDVQALVALPLLVEDRCIGVLSFSFDAARKWDTAEREFFLTLAAQFLAALERARLLGNERHANEELWKQASAMRLMADISTLLASSLDYEAVLRQLTQMVVPVVADWCAVDVLDQSGRIQRLSAFHADPEKMAIAQDLERRYPGDPEALQGVPNVLRSGETEWVRDIPDSLLEAAARDEEHLRTLRQLGLRSYVVVPLRARGRILGALSLIYAESGRQYTPDEVRYVEELAARAALSVDNALLFKEQVDARERLERQSRQAMLVGDVGAALTRSETLNEALQHCSEAVVRHLNAAFARIWTSNAREGVLELQASAGLYTHVDGAHGRVPIGQYKIGRIAQQGAPHLTNDVQQDPWVSDRDWARREGMVSFAGYPLIIEGKVIGVMALFARTPLADDTLTALSAVADTIAIGIERARADQRAREERDTLEVVNEVGRALAAELDREKLVQAITDSATKLAGAAFGAFFYNVIDAAGESYTLYAISGVAREAFSRFPMPRNTKVFAPTFAGEGIVRVDDIRKDPRYGQNPPYLGMPEGHLPVASYLAVPVISRSGAVIGGLFFGHPQPAVFSERSQMLVSGVAAQAATAMDNARLFRDAQRLISQLDKSNKELDQFAYVASHDLKAPLRGISNLSQWIEEDLADVITADGKEQLTLLRSRVNRMEGLINGILDYSRAGRVRTKIEAVSVEKLLREVVELSSAPEGAAIQIQPGMPELRTERTPLQQVFLNLIGNALKHAKRSDPQVLVSCKDTGEAFEFSVADNGPGIAPEYHERIWQIFQTLEPRDTVEGTGVGLSVVKKIAESKGGQAWLESSLGSGATFYFTWPKTEQEAMKSV
jgi:GAF domain-containing protein/AmiR/NasT family two-component response regulator/two-component sensor histidine kinase